MAEKDKKAAEQSAPKAAAEAPKAAAVAAEANAADAKSDATADVTAKLARITVSGGGGGGATPAKAAANGSGGSGDEAKAAERKAPPSAADLKRYEAYVGEKWTGKCRWFNVMKGFGFIDPHYAEAKEKCDDVFVHQSALQMEGFRSLDEGEEVVFIVALGKNGLEASKVEGADGAKLRGHHVRPLGKKREKMIRCFKCGQLGFHRASRCKKDIPAKACYHCHSSGHLVGDCPDYQAQKLARETSKAKV